jgi:hypothetical protein
MRQPQRLRQYQRVRQPQPRRQGFDFMNQFLPEVTDMT